MEQHDDTDVGLRLRLARERQGLSQRALARRAGVGNGTISLIESGASNPSVGALKRILKAIPMDLATFFSFELPERHSSFYRAAELVEIGKGRVSYRLVGADLPAKKVQMLHERYAPGADSGRVRLSHDGEECGVVISGRLEVWVGAERRLLGPGDAYYFDSRTPHRFRNPDGNEICVVVSACSPASF